MRSLGQSGVLELPVVGHFFLMKVNNVTFWTASFFSSQF